MIVIARNNGPIYEIDGSRERRGLIEGKEYTVIEWSYQDTSGSWIKRKDDFVNPKEPKFFIKVVNEDSITHDYWNDYFLSSKEIRHIKIDKILQ
jgi:hypothetical protein